MSGCISPKGGLLKNLMNPKTRKLRRTDRPAAFSFLPHFSFFSLRYFLFSTLRPLVAYFYCNTFLLFLSLTPRLFNHTRARVCECIVILFYLWRRLLVRGLFFCLLAPIVARLEKKAARLSLACSRFVRSEIRDRQSRTKFFPHLT